jgi:hypothetical protein
MEWIQQTYGSVQEVAVLNTALTLRKRRGIS